MPQSITPSTISEFLKKYRKRHCEAERLNMDSLDWKLKVLDRRFGALPLTALEKPGPIDDFKAELIRAGKKHATVNRYLAQLKHMINWAIGRELMAKNPFFNKTRNPTGIRLLKGEGKRRRRSYAQEERALLEACDAINAGAHDYAGSVMKGRIYAAVDLGLRRGEMLKATNRDINWKEKPDPILTIQWGNAKSRKERQIPLTSARVIRFLKSRRWSAGLTGPFGSATGGHLQNFRKAWETVLKLAHITDAEKGWTATCIGTICVTNAAAALPTAAWMDDTFRCCSGHSDLKTTERYLNSDTRRLAEAMKRATGGRA